MNYKLIIGLWIMLSASIVYWDMHRYYDIVPLSDCHGAKIKIYHDKPVCIECKMFCEISKKKE